MAALEGAEAARATATGMAAVTAALMGQLKAGDHVVAAQGAVRLLPLRGRGSAAALRHRLDAGRRHRPRRSGARRCGRTPRPSSWKARPIRRSRSSTSPRSRRSRTRPARRSSSTTCSPRRCCRARSSSAPTASSIRRPSTSTARAAASAASSCVGEVHRTTMCTVAPPDRPVAVAVQRLGAAQGAGDAAGAGARGRPRPPATIADALAEHPKITRLIYPGRPTIRRPTIVQKQMSGGSTLVALRGQGRQGGRVPLPERAQAHPHLQQSRRRQEPDHPSGDDHAPAADAGAARRARHQRRPGAPLGRARTSRRPRSRICWQRWTRCERTSRMSAPIGA